MADYRAWIVIQRWDQVLGNILGRFGNPNLALHARPKMSLRRKGDQGVEMCVANPASVLGNLQAGDKIRAITSAAQADVRLFHKKLFAHMGGRYRILCDLCSAASPSPYSRRFLTIRAELPGTYHQLTDTTPIVRNATSINEFLEDATPIVGIEPESPNLWLEPQVVELTKAQVAFEFGPVGAASQLEASFILPPFRSKDDSEALESYFDPRLLELRESLFGLLGEFHPKRDAAASSMMRLCDEPILGDILMDGGALRLASEEGRPTLFVLHVNEGGGEAAGYRGSTILNPERVQGPLWAKDLARALRDDIRNLLPGGGLEITRAEQTATWNVVKSAEVPKDGFYSPGSWDALSELGDRLPSGSEAWELFWKRILRPGMPIQGRLFPDHDMAERLFMHYAWRCPWAYVPGSLIDAWREAFREILATEFKGDFPTPEDRVERWNSAARSTNFTQSRKGDDPHVDENIFVLKHSGDPNPDEVIRWRLLLPWRSIVNARTIILDRPTRSRLDGTFVVA